MFLLAALSAIWYFAVNFMFCLCSKSLKVSFGLSEERIYVFGEPTSWLFCWGECSSNINQMNYLFFGSNLKC